MANFGGFGQEAFGDPFGAGGPLHVVRARAVKGHVVRVVFDEEPYHASSSGRFDALNPANYLVEAVVGEVFGGSIFTTGVDSDLIVGPTYGPVYVGDERAVDVHVDRPFVLGMTYRVTAINIVSQFGGALGAPTSAEFPGVVQPAVAAKVRRRLGYVDFATDVVGGNYVVDDSGDIAVTTAESSLRKRVFRRASTPRGAFAHLPDYGVGMRLKDVAGPSDLQTLKTELTQQIKQEPDVQDVDIITSLTGDGLLQVIISLTTNAGVLPPVTLSRTSGGAISFS